MVETSRQSKKSIESNESNYLCSDQVRKIKM